METDKQHLMFTPIERDSQGYPRGIVEQRNTVIYLKGIRDIQTTIGNFGKNVKEKRILIGNKKEKAIFFKDYKGTCTLPPSPFPLETRKTKLQRNIFVTGFLID